MVVYDCTIFYDLIDSDGEQLIQESDVFKEIKTQAYKYNVAPYVLQHD